MVLTVTARGRSEPSAVGSPSVDEGTDCDTVCRYCK